MDMPGLLLKMVEMEASDLFISENSAPLVNVEGEMRSIENRVLNAESCHQLIYSILNEKERSEFEANLELNKSLMLADAGRFRINVFRQRGQPSMVARRIKSVIPSLDQLGLPSALKDFALEERGLILLVGGTGTGKSTTLASMIDYRNAHVGGHILTIEDPIEFVHTNKKSLVNQREVGIDTLSYDAALKNALREAPDVILIGEVRDRHTMKQAISYAETGHLCLATLHANNANQALSRIINFFPEDAHPQLLQDLSLNLRAVVAQRLCRGVDGKRVAALEIMSRSAYIADLIERGRIDEIKDVMAKAEGRLASRTFDQALFELVRGGRIDEEEALRHADSRNNLSLRFRLEGTDADEGIPIKSEYTVDAHAPFETYASFKITPRKVETPDVTAEERFTASLAHAMGRKGMIEDPDHPDLEIQYVYGLSTTKGLDLEPVADEGDSLQYYKPRSSQHHLLVINVVDLKSRKPVYRLTASSPKAEGEAPENESSLNRIFVDLLKSLPVGSDLQAPKME